MENQRYILLIALAVISGLMYFNWQAEYADSAPVIDRQHVDADEPGADSGGVAQGQSDSDSSSRDGADPEAPGELADKAEPKQVTDGTADKGENIKVSTDLLEVEISTHGGDIRQVDLLKYDQSSDNEAPFRLMRDEGDPFFIARAGLGRDGPGRNAKYEVNQEKFTLSKGKEQVEVPLVWRQGNVEVRKVYTFKRDSYTVDVRHEVIKNGAGFSMLSSFANLIRRVQTHGIYVASLVEQCIHLMTVTSAFLSAIWQIRTCAVMLAVAGCQCFSTISSPLSFLNRINNIAFIHGPYRMRLI